jgi:hypothetical protein
MDIVSVWLRQTYQLLLVGVQQCGKRKDVQHVARLVREMNCGAEAENCQARVDPFSDL